MKSGFLQKLLKLPIMLVLLLCGLMLLMHLSRLGIYVSFAGQHKVAFFILVVAVSIVLLSAYSFKRAKTTLNPIQPEMASSLVSSGFYQLSRNPMYVGFLLVLFACVVYMGNIINLVLLPLFVWLANRLYIIPEEKALEALFKDEYREYMQQVRRWI